MSYFTNQEKIANKVVPALLEPMGYTVTRAEGQFKSYDFKIEKNGAKADLEFKARQASSSQYPTWILEHKKVENIGLPFLYLNTYTDGVARIWLVTEDLLSRTESGTRKFPDKTGGRSTKWVNKDVHYLTPDTAIMTKKTR
mgnify:CR=1 FL=1